MTHRWQKKKTQVSHTDDWLLTYADIITLLLCFFAIIIITSMPKKHLETKIGLPQILEQAQQSPHPPPQMAQPKIPDVFPGDLPFRPIEQFDSQADTIPHPVPANAEEATPAPLPSPAVAEVVPPPAPPLPTIAVEVPPPAPAPSEPKGDRISVLEMPSATFFDSGSATLNAAGIPILQDLATRLQSDAYKNYQITVEGHTDDTPIHTAQFPSNWELSTARASAVVHFFLDQGIPATRLRAAGYADTFPKAPNRDSNGTPIPENRAENRRVVITLEKIENN
jgi:flagellar motor protein MotB